jgi:quercetin dioxygenase-like cupin family protein
LSDNFRQTTNEKGRKDMQSTDKVYVQTREEAQAPWFLGVVTAVRATAEQTQGAYSLFEQILPPGIGMPPHMHHNEDESFFVLEGTVTIWVGEHRITATPGTWVFGPRDVRHAFRGEGDAPARLLLSLNPSGFEHFIYALGEKNPPTAPPDMDKVISVAKKYGVTILSGSFPD